MTIWGILSVALGSAVGGVCRYMLSQHIGRGMHWGTFPASTFVVNAIGCLLLGFITGYIERAGGMTPVLRLFLTVGFCGGFTTFSTFAMETYSLVGTSRDLLIGITYLLLSVLIGVQMVYIGERLGRGC